MDNSGSRLASRHIAVFYIPEHSNRDKNLSWFVFVTWRIARNSRSQKLKQLINNGSWFTRPNHFTIKVKHKEIVSMSFEEDVLKTFVPRTGPVRNLF